MEDVKNSDLIYWSKNRQRRKRRIVVRGEPYKKLVGGVGCMAIPLTRGMTALVDLKDYDIVKDFSWFCYKDKKRDSHYVSANAFHKKKNYGVKIHRIIMGLDPGDKRVVDHINGNGLDNRRINLRVCEPIKNAWNRRPNDGNIAGYKGVSYKRHLNKWQVDITVEGKRRYLGVYPTPDEAGKVADIAYKVLCGNFSFRKEDGRR